MDVQRSSLCNSVVNFLLEENYLLSAFELLHELLDDGRDDQAIRLKQFFSDPAHFPPDQISRFNSLRVLDPQTLLEEKESLEEKLAVREYELRLAQEDILSLKAEVLKKTEYNLDESRDAVPIFLFTDVIFSQGSLGAHANTTANNGPIVQPIIRDISFSDLGPLKDNERLDLNCAVKEYLLLAGYRLTAMTFYEEVTDQNLDVWENSSACVPDALRHYYYQYLCSTAEAAEEKIKMLQENEALRKENDRQKSNGQSLLKSKEMSDAQVMALTKSLESLQKDMKEKETLVQDLKTILESQRKELNDCRAEITSLKMHIEGAQSGKSILATDSAPMQSLLENHSDKIELLQNDVEILKPTSVYADPIESIKREDGNAMQLDKVEEPQVNDNASSAVGSLSGKVNAGTDMTGKQGSDDTTSISEKVPEQLLTSSGESGLVEKVKLFAWTMENRPKKLTTLLKR
ncbi:UNVERIFIED_CONTAM: hypothetical protein Scaly_2147100 [Sesamum calycinum]|uniref:LisH domain-containing protein n=1 Tax=Sesamum calycinum TaxID=2727403 RepID=A0AAW2MQW1_9LAMI